MYPLISLSSSVFTYEKIVPRIFTIKRSIYKTTDRCLVILDQCPRISLDQSRTIQLYRNVLDFSFF